MKHHINKYRMADDIVLTVSLILSVILVKTIMHLTGLAVVEYDGVIFLTSCFISIKIMYNVLTKLTKKYINMRSIR